MRGKLPPTPVDRTLCRDIDSEMIVVVFVAVTPEGPVLPSFPFQAGRITTLHVYTGIHMNIKLNNYVIGISLSKPHTRLKNEIV